ncbi:MBOAT family protein [Myxosarcina sp. GI1]|uniref:MBOAT family O-acyltransferase n=1 Tax=Myxosarcina sp. GI1 TaxID=1541065 RepID=UPI00055A0400|nr:MBOAT family protein [Myxosarcina sp. GI1]
MLFNSFEFILLFLPITLSLFFWFGKKSNYKQLPVLILVIASLFFYGWWNPANLPIIIISILFNYGLGVLLGNVFEGKTAKKAVLILGVIFNLGLIGYFKYANFFINNVNQLLGTEVNLPPIVLPLAISFFTFQQIAYLVDAYRGETKEYSLLKYMLFVCFFPQLIAGPIVHHKEILPQFNRPSIYHFDRQVFAIGLSVFMAGLFKKVVLADRIAEYSNLAFGAAAQGIDLTFSEAWIGALAYSLQLYFDFSGYSDMAIGAAYMFGIKLPLNFNSPYKSISIVDFWRRWHITLSHFLRDYLYIPLGGSRRGELRRYSNLLITMLLGGLWHGAGWTFVFWGGLHGIYLVVNHLYRSLRKYLGHNLRNDGWLLRGVGWLVTFIAVVISWVFFRASSFDTALGILGAMFGANGIQLPPFFEPHMEFLRNWGVGFQGITVNVGISQKYATFGVAMLLLIAWFTPNTQQWMGIYNPTLTEPTTQNRPLWLERFWQILAWRPNKIWSVIIAGLTSVSLLCFTRVSEFLYFQF